MCKYKVGRFCPKPMQHLHLNEGGGKKGVPFRSKVCLQSNFAVLRKAFLTIFWPKLVLSKFPIRHSYSPNWLELIKSNAIHSQRSRGYSWRYYKNVLQTKLYQKRSGKFFGVLKPEFPWEASKPDASCRFDIVGLRRSLCSWIWEPLL